MTRNLLLCTLVSAIGPACGGGAGTNATSEPPVAASRPVETEPASVPNTRPDTGADTPEPPVPTEPAARREPDQMAKPGLSLDPTLDEKIKSTFASNCRFERRCGEILGVDCDAAVDGPYYYVKPGTLEILSKCGGHCMGGGCTECPPPGWDCKVY